MKPRLARAAGKAAVWAGVAGVLAAVFAAYLNPHFAFDLATRFWACF